MVQFKEILFSTDFLADNFWKSSVIKTDFKNYKFYQKNIFKFCFSHHREEKNDLGHLKEEFSQEKRFFFHHRKQKKLWADVLSVKQEQKHLRSTKVTRETSNFHDFRRDRKSSQRKCKKKVLFLLTMPFVRVLDALSAVQNCCCWFCAGFGCCKRGKDLEIFLTIFR